MILDDKIIQLGNPLLRQKSEPVDLANREEIDFLLGEMQGALERVSKQYEFTWAMGIAAVQLGHLKRACMIWMPHLGFVPFFNPEITAESKTTNKGWEGCMSFFDKRGMAVRPDWIDVTYYDADGKQHSKRYEDKEVRILQHEIDHMNGILYTDRMEEGDELMDAETYIELKK